MLSKIKVMNCCYNEFIFKALWLFVPDPGVFSALVSTGVSQVIGGPAVLKSH